MYTISVFLTLALSAWRFCLRCVSSVKVERHIIDRKIDEICSVCGGLYFTSENTKGSLLYFIKNSIYIYSIFSQYILSLWQQCIIQCCFNQWWSPVCIRKCFVTKLSYNERQRRKKRNVFFPTVGQASSHTQHTIIEATAKVLRSARTAAQQCIFV